MGSYNTYPGSEEKPVISILSNSIHYFIECVYIIKSKCKYRLVVLHNNRVLCDQYYSTLRGCRIAFDKMFRGKAWTKKVKADWSHFYDPDKRWLAEKLSHLENRNMAEKQ
jgi:hypothetical protein